MSDGKDGPTQKGAAGGGPPAGGAGVPRPITALLSLDAIDKVKEEILAEAREVEAKEDEPEKGAAPAPLEGFAPAPVSAISTDEPVPAALSGELAVVGAKLGGYELHELLEPGWHTADKSGQPALVHAFDLPSEDAADAVALALAQVSRLTAEEVVRPLEHGRSGDTYWIAYPPDDGRTIASLLADSMFPNAVAVMVLGGVLRALEAAHGAGLLHLALRPEHVVLREDGHVTVRGFGVASSLPDDSPFVASEPMSRAPEQLAAGALGPAADLHAAGVLTWHMITRKNPYQRDDAREERQAVATGQRRDLFDDKHPDVPPSLYRLLEVLLRTDPDARPASAREALDRLEPLLTRVNARYPTVASAFCRDPFGMLKMLAGDQSRREMWRARRALAEDGDDARFIAAVAYLRALSLNPLNTEADAEWRQLARTEGFTEDRAVTDEVRSLEGLVGASPTDASLLGELVDARVAAGDVMGGARAVLAGSMVTGDSGLYERAGRLFGATEDAPFDEEPQERVRLSDAETLDEPEAVHRLPGYDDRPAAFDKDRPIERPEPKDTLQVPALAEVLDEDDSAGDPTVPVASLASLQERGEHDEPTQRVRRAPPEPQPSEQGGSGLAVVAILGLLVVVGAAAGWYFLLGPGKDGRFGSEPTATEKAAQRRVEEVTAAAQREADRRAALEREAAEKKERARKADEARAAAAVEREEKQRQLLIDAAGLATDGDHAAAIEALNKVIELDPITDVATEARLLRAGAREQLGDLPGAVLELKNVLSSVKEDSPAFVRAQKQLERVQASR